jgi:hypothetical protein
VELQLKQHRDKKVDNAAALAKKRTREAGEKKQRQADKAARKQAKRGGGGGRGGAQPEQGPPRPPNDMQVVQMLPLAADEDRVRPLRALRGFCLFHLGGALNMRGKEADKTMACFTPAGQPCPHGSHEQPPPAVARAIADDMQAALDGKGPPVAFSPSSKKLFIAALGRVAGGGR